MPRWNRRFRSTICATWSGRASPAGLRSCTPMELRSRMRARSFSTTCTTSRTIPYFWISASSSRRCASCCWGKAADGDVLLDDYTQRPPPGNSASVIAIFVPDDVVLAEVSAGLYFDEVQRLVGRILQPVFRAERNEGRFVFAHFVNLVIARHARPAGDDDPMLRALVMHLQ